MKTSDHLVETLLRNLWGEAEALERRAARLREISDLTKTAIKDGTVTVHSFEFVAQEAIDVITHRSSVMPQTIARTCASLAAEAAVDWARAHPEA